VQRVRFRKDLPVTLQTRRLRALLRNAPLLLIALGLFSIPNPASADCALIPTALQPLASTLGSVDRPFAAPGDTVRLFSVGACDPLADQFDPDPANNQITLSMEVVPASTPMLRATRCRGFSPR